MYKQSKMIRNLLYFSKFNKNKTIFYHLRVTLVPVHLMTCMAHTSELMRTTYGLCILGGLREAGGCLASR